MLPPTPEQIAKLPRWARDHINSLVMRIDNLRRRNAFYDGDLPTDTSIQYGIYEEDNQPLPRGSTIQFDMVKSDAEFRRRLHLSIRRLREDDAVLVMGSYCISVEPHSGNVVLIRLKPR